MNKFLVVVFPNEADAYEGVRQLQQLHDEGSVTIFEAAVIQRKPDGTLVVRERPEGPIGLGVGALLGGLIGLFGGPVGAAVGLGAGVALGGARDILHAEVSDEFLDKVEEDLTPGKFAIVSEVSEEWTTPLDTRMERIGGKVVREWRDDFVDDVLEQRANRRKERVARWKAERAGAKAERSEARIDTEIEHERDKLKASAEKARERLDRTKQEMDAKLKALEEQASRAKPEVQRHIQQRITDLRQDLQAREMKLNRAYQLAQEALQP